MAVAPAEQPKVYLFVSGDMLPFLGMFSPAPGVQSQVGWAELACSEIGAEPVSFSNIIVLGRSADRSELLCSKQLVT